jgi:hypothetical protein
MRLQWVRVARQQQRWVFLQGLRLKSRFQSQGKTHTVYSGGVPAPTKATWKKQKYNEFKT